MKVNRHLVHTFALLLVFLAFAPLSCLATTITLDMTGIDWHFDSTSETFDLSLPAAKGSLTFALNPNAAYVQSTPTAYTAVERALSVNITDRSGWALLDIKADFHFDGGILNVDVTTVQVKSMELAMRNPTSVTARQFFYPNSLAAPSSDYGAMWGGAQNIAALTTQYHFNIGTDAGLFAPMIAIPPAFLFPDTPSSPGPGNPLLFADSSDNPEPASIVLMGTGLGALIWFMRRRQRRSVVTVA